MVAFNLDVCFLGGAILLRICFESLMRTLYIYLAFACMSLNLKQFFLRDKTVFKGWKERYIKVHPILKGTGQNKY